MLEKKEKLYEGKSKILYRTDDPRYLIQYFKDDATAFNNKKKGTIRDKGIFNNAISTVIFKYLEKNGIRTHYREKLNDREMAVRALTIFPVEVIVRNRAAGSLAKRLGVEEGTTLKWPIMEFCYKSDALDDPLISPTVPLAFGWMTQREVDNVTSQTWKINTLMIRFFDEKGIELIDYKLEYGKDREDQIFLADEISPDSCRLWEKGTGKKLDKDRFRRDLGDIEAAYRQIQTLVEGHTS